MRSVADSTVTYCRIFTRTEGVGLQVGIYTCPTASHEHRRTRVHVIVQRAVTPQRCICSPDRSLPLCNPGTVCNARKVIGVVPETVRTSRSGSSAADVPIPALSRAAGQSGWAQCFRGTDSTTVAFQPHDGLSVASCFALTCRAVSSSNRPHALRNIEKSTQM